MSVEITEEIIEINNKPFKWLDIYSELVEKIPVGKRLIKLSLASTSSDKLSFRAIYSDDFTSPIEEPFKPGLPYIRSVNASIKSLLVPTGVGASFGGYAGDANPLAKAFSLQSKHLLTHPNVVNGSVLTDIPSNLIYLEGYLLDEFLLGKLSLKPNKKNKIGVIFDSGISESRVDYEVNVLNSLRAFYGCDIETFTVTEKPIVVTPTINKFGFSSGSISNIDYLLKEAYKLKDLGVNSIAICCRIPDLELNNSYLSGEGVDPIGGIEAIISHIVSAATGLPSAHAPVLVDEEKIDYKEISPLSAGEYISKTFLPSVISGLRFSPIVEMNDTKGSLTNSDIEKLLVPHNAFGGPGALYLSASENSPVVLVEENNTVLNVNKEHLDLKFSSVSRYTDLLDVEQVEESGISLDSLKRPVSKINKLICSYAQESSE